MSDARREASNELAFLVRVHNGFTLRLFSNDGKAGSLYALIDGPYGGVNRPIYRLFDHVILVVGGGGVSAALSWVQDLSCRLNKEQARRVPKVSLVWCVRH